MALRRQMDDTVNPVLLQQGTDCLEIADVRLHERVVRPVFDVPEIRQVPGVGQPVQIDDTVVRVSVHEQAHHMAPDEARAACYKDGSSVVHGRSIVIILLSRQNT